MSATDSNSTLFDQGMAKAFKLIENHLKGQLYAICDKMVQWPPLVNHAGWLNLTGNTTTSYACGLYINGALDYMVFKGDTSPKPTRVKLKKGETYFLDVDGPDYDGRLRTWGPANIDTDGGYGQDFSAKFLRGYTSKVKKGFEIVMCTGTEYSTYIEKVRNGDVLTSIFERARSELATNFKPIG